MAKNILIFTGNGKGKSTAAFGMAMRAAGHGQRVLVLQFIKANSKTGELASCDKLGIDVRQLGRGFVPKLDHPAYADHKAAAETGWQQAEAALQNTELDLLVLDEVCGAVGKGLLDEDVVLNAVRNSAPELNVVLTGRGATEEMIALADTVSEMVVHKHALQDGRSMRIGIEY